MRGRRGAGRAGRRERLGRKRRTRTTTTTTTMDGHVCVYECNETNDDGEFARDVGCV
jgi:hypothetical protein